MSAPVCAICGKPAHPVYRPFCSARCANVDLNRWLTGAYAIPAETPEEADSAREDDGDS